MSKSSDNDDLVALNSGHRAALKLYAPHMSDETHGRVLSGTPRSLVISVGDKVVIKSGTERVITEERNLRYVKQNFSLPAPELFGLYNDPTHGHFLVVEYREGESLDRAWPNLIDKEKQQVLVDLNAAVDQMRLRTETYIGSVGKQPFADSHGALHEPQLGPFDTEDAFNNALLMRFSKRYKHHAPVFLEMLRQHGDHSIVFAHGDLQMKNILVNKGRVSGIVDWEHAGFYPDYWDYAHAADPLLFDEPALQDYPAYLQRFLKPYPVESAVIELIASKMCGGY